MKKILSLLLAALMLLSLTPVVMAEATGSLSLKINPYGGEETDIDTVSWFSSAGNFFLFLPADMDLNAAKVYFTASGDVALDGETIVSGESAVAFTEGTHTLVCGDVSYPLTVCRSANIPAVFIETESGSLDHIHANKENTEKGNIRVYENGEMTLDKALKQIKGRGNATWTYPKKPYNIKFDKKTDLFGMGKAKKWTLLANYFDFSLIHNVYGWEFARAFGLPHTSEYQHVDLYINGNYMGNYVICESVEIADNRIDINDLEKANENANDGVDIEALPRGGTGANHTVQSYAVKGSRKWIEIPETPDNITGGYLLEYEYGGRYDAEPCGFVTYNGQPIVIKSPEYAAQAEVNYIADFVDAGSKALYSDSGYNDDGKHYSDYFDFDSLVNMYILQELSMNYDAAFSSFYAYKAEDSDKLIFAPVWDMDNAFGSSQANMSVPLTSYSLWWVNQMAYHGIPSVLSAACRHEEFRTAVRERWASLRQTGTFESINARMEDLLSELHASALMNGLRWNHFATVDPALSGSKWLAAADISVDFVAARTAALDVGFGEDGAYLYYDVNGASSGSWSMVSPISRIGDSVTVRAITGNGTVNPPSGKIFYCWNTSADGNGENYRPGDTLTLQNESTILYAIWKTQAEIDAESNTEPLTEPAVEPTTEPSQQDDAGKGNRSVWQSILDFFNRIIAFFRRLFGTAA